MNAVLQLVVPMPEYGMNETRNLELHFSGDQGWTSEFLKRSLTKVILEGTEFQVKDVSIHLNKFEVTLRSSP